MIRYAEYQRESKRMVNIPYEQFVSRLLKYTTKTPEQINAAKQRILGKDKDSNAKGNVGRSRSGSD